MPCWGWILIAAGVIILFLWMVRDREEGGGDSYDEFMDRKR